MSWHPRSLSSPTAEAPGDPFLLLSLTAHCPAAPLPPRPWAHVQGQTPYHRRAHTCRATPAPQLPSQRGGGADKSRVWACPGVERARRKSTRSCQSVSHGGGQQKAMGRGRGEAPTEGPEQARDSFPAQTRLQRRGREPGPTPLARPLEDTHRSTHTQYLHAHTHTLTLTHLRTQTHTHAHSHVRSLTDRHTGLYTHTAGVWALRGASCTLPPSGPGWVGSWALGGALRTDPGSEASARAPA